MRFWDASALVPLCVDQPESARTHELLKEDAVMVVWWGSVVECWSAFARLRREGVLGSADEEVACGLLQALLGYTPGARVSRCLLSLARHGPPA